MCGGGVSVLSTYTSVGYKKQVQYALQKISSLTVTVFWAVCSTVDKYLIFQKVILHYNTVDLVRDSFNLEPQVE